MPFEFQVASARAVNTARWRGFISPKGQAVRCDLPSREVAFGRSVSVRTARLLPFARCGRFAGTIGD